MQKIESRALQVLQFEHKIDEFDSPPLWLLSLFSSLKPLYIYEGRFEAFWALYTPSTR